MKADAIGLEVVIKLDYEEFSILENNTLCSFMKFRGMGEQSDENKKIFFELYHLREQKKLLEVKTIPENKYFSKVEKIIFSINDYFYNGIREYNYYVDRFSIGGKLCIRLLEEDGIDHQYIY